MTWTLSNLCRNKNPPPNLEAIKNVLPKLAILINHPDNDVVSDACWALSYLTDGSNDKIEIIIQTGVVPRLVELLGHSNVTVIVSNAKPFCLGKIYLICVMYIYMILETYL